MNIEGKLLIIWHSRTGASEALAAAAAQGAGEEAVLMPATQVMPDHLRDAGAYLFVCPENLASMSGLMKEMFDRNYYALLGQIEGRAYATIIAAGVDGEGAERQLDRIVTGWRLKRVSPSVIANMDADTPDEIMKPKSVSPDFLRIASELGQAMAAGLRIGIY